VKNTNLSSDLLAKSASMAATRRHVVLNAMTWTVASAGFSQAALASSTPNGPGAHPLPGGHKASQFPRDFGAHPDLQTEWWYVAMVSLILGFIGLGIRFLADASPVVRYLSDASYWMYIAHLPVVMALQTWMMSFELHWIVKFAIVTFTTCAVLLLMYRYWVRSTWIGQLLNGRKYSGVGSSRTCEPVT